jgi:alkylhydroperoxidase family enzyme
MPRIPPLEREQTEGEVRNAFDEGVARWGRMTNMKRTLLHSLPSYRALMQWYPLFDTVKTFLGERLAIIFAHAISSESHCLICTTYMRRILIEWGENPNELKLDPKGDALVEFGRALSRHGNRVPDELYQKMACSFSPPQIVALTAFAALMVATNIINNVLEVDLDEYLYEYRDKKPATPVKHGT